LRGNAYSSQNFSNWSGDIGVNKVFDTNTTRIPTLDVSCEDYGLLFRLAENNQGPVVRVTADAEATGLRRIAMTPSPITGAAGNREFFLHLRTT
jgi:carboxypeptidase Q